MSYAVTIHLDAEGERQLARLWRHLAEDRVTSEMIDLGIPPHVTLLVADDIEQTHARRALSELASGMAPFAITATHIGVFSGERGVTFVGLATTRALLSLHDRLLTCLDGAVTGVWKNYLRDSWVPHCTLAMHLDDAVVPRAVASALESFTPFTVGVTGLGIAELPNGRMVAIAPFGAGSPDRIETHRSARGADV